MKHKEEYTFYLLRSLKYEDKATFREELLILHPADQFDFFITLDTEMRMRVYAYLTPAELVHIFRSLTPRHQLQVLAEVEEHYAHSLLKQMYTDDLVDLLGHMSRTDVSHYLKRLDPEQAERVRTLLSYQPKTAGALMTTEFFTVSLDETTGDVLERLRSKAERNQIYSLYVTDQAEMLLGVLSLRELITARNQTLVRDVMRTHVVSVTALTPQEEVARMMRKYRLLNIPVTLSGKLVGLITVDDIMDVIDEQTDETFGEIAATGGSMDTSLTSFQAASRRAPWMLLFMMLSMLTAGVVGQFEATLGAYVLLAVFIPLVMDSSGNTGIQALTVVVRSLALGTADLHSVGKLLKRECGTGILLGVFCGFALMIFIPVIYPNGGYWLGVIVGSTLFLTLSISTLIGATIPLLIHRLKIDPAIASGPFITTINDMIGLSIYFSIATALLHQLPQ